MSEFNRKEFKFDKFCGEVEVLLTSPGAPKPSRAEAQRIGAEYLHLLKEEQAPQISEPRTGTFNANLSSVVIPSAFGPLK